MSDYSWSENRGAGQFVLGLTLKRFGCGTRTKVNPRRFDPKMFQ